MANTAERSGQAGPTDDTATRGYASVNGLEMYYEIHGAGRPLVLLNGGPMVEAFLDAPLPPSD